MKYLVAIGLIGIMAFSFVPIPVKVDYYWYHVVMAEMAHDDGWGYSETGNRVKDDIEGFIEDTVGNIVVSTDEIPLIECRKMKKYIVWVYGYPAYRTKMDQWENFINEYKHYWHQHYDIQSSSRNTLKKVE